MFKNLPLAANGSLKMYGNDAATLVEASKISLQLLLFDLGSQILFNLSSTCSHKKFVCNTNEVKCVNKMF